MCVDGLEIDVISERAHYLVEVRGSNPAVRLWLGGKRLLPDRVPLDRGQDGAACFQPEHGELWIEF